MQTPEQVWNSRYQDLAYAYGELPNEFFKEHIQQLIPGKLFLPAEGEGRNAVHAAALGWDVNALDISEAGKNKALKLAEKHHVQIHYQVADMGLFSYAPQSFDAIGLIYAHFPASKKSTYHQQLGQYVKMGGYIIFEAFSKSHLTYQEINPGVGGPKDIDILFSVQEIEIDFDNFETIFLKEETIELNEGIYHKGKGSVIRYIGKRCK
jgi:hypothetical protein